ncbi:DoxX family protein [Streptomyces sp. S3(2020)]|uniref:DoxX family protein n=1 Tax=Streptomyces sp. S3(2020) TaxID=2732044 RepID=UPI001487FE25|nr:DoxX family protein [Streptomyces sp. S3(2020)]
MVVAYWIVAALLGLFYLYAGGKKIAQSQEELAPMMGWVDTVPMPAVRLVGAVEILGVAGLVLPPLTGIAPVLAVLAAVGFVVLQVLAAGLHLSRGEAKDTGLNVVLIALAGVAAWLATAF